MGFIIFLYMLSLAFAIPIFLETAPRLYSDLAKVSLAVFWPISLFFIMLKTLWKTLNE